MILIERQYVCGFEAAIRGMRNPMNSWAKSDSGISYLAVEGDSRYEVGEDDMKLMKQLVNAGTDHSKFMRMIIVTCDIIAPLYWWKEFDTYKVGTVRNSCSTMHKIHDKEFNLSDFSHEHLILHSSNGEICRDWRDTLEGVIDDLNAARELYLRTGDKRYWWQMIQLLPSSYNQRSTVQMNYAVLRSMYQARKNHKLDEWHDFCRWAEQLPVSSLITQERE